MKPLHHSLRLRTLTVGALCAAAAALLPSSALAADHDRGYVSALKTPAVVDGVRLTKQQVKHRFAHRPLYFVLGSREEAAGAVAAFTTPGKRNAYLRATGRSHGRNRHGAHASYNGNESDFYEDPFLEGASIPVAHVAALGNLADYGMPWRFWENWDNRISSAKTGSWGARLYDRPYLDCSAGCVDIPGKDSVEIWRFFDNVTSSIWNY